MKKRGNEGIFYGSTVFLLQLKEEDRRRGTLQEVTPKLLARQCAGNTRHIDSAATFMAKGCFLERAKLSQTTSLGFGAT